MIIITSDMITPRFLNEFPNFKDKHHLSKLRKEFIIIGDKEKKLVY